MTRQTAPSVRQGIGRSPSRFEPWAVTTDNGGGRLKGETMDHALLRQRFWPRVKKRGANDCWLWCAATSLGYGDMRVKGALLKSHRVSWQIHNGPIPKGKHILHRCDVRSCVNPAHLFLGTHLENAQDMSFKGRGGSQRLSYRDAQAIRKQHATGTVIQLLADKYGVAARTVRDVVNGKTHKGPPQ